MPTPWHVAPVALTLFLAPALVQDPSPHDKRTDPRGIASAPHGGGAQLGLGGFVERALEIGLDHQALCGVDTFDNPEVTGKIARDWVNVGLACGDIDNDGDLDVFANGALLPNRLFRNDGGTFVDITAGSPALNRGEFDRCSAMVDFDRDGHMDLFVGEMEGSGDGPRPAHSRLYRNLGGGVFEDVTALSSTHGNGRTVHGYWYDLDLDGLADLYTSEFNLTANHWYRNNGDGSFTEMGAVLGIDSAGSTHVTSMVDTDQDGLVDVIVANDYLVGSAVEFEPSINPGDRYLHGQPDGTFADISGPVNMAHAKGVMGLTFTDVDYDGDLDVYKSNIQNNLLVINHGAPGSGTQWQQMQVDYGVQNDQVPFINDPENTGASVGWGVHFFNANFDRWDDLFVVNGHVAAANFHTAHLPKPQPDYLFIGLGPDEDFHFEDQTEAFGLNYFNDERGSVIGDFDLDGDTDIIVASSAGRLHYHENNVDRQGRGAIQIVAETLTSAPHGIGTIVSWSDSEGYPHTRVIGLDSPTASQTAYELEFGLGLEPDADLLVRFPSGIVRSYPDQLPGTRLVAQEPELFRVSTRKLAIAGSSLGPSEVTITAFAHTFDGTPLGENATVSISLPGLSATGPVQHVQGNEFQRTFLTSSIARSYRCNLEFNGFRPRVAPQIHVYGPPSSATAEALPEAVRAGSSDTFTLWLSPKDANGISVGSGLDVDLVSTPALEPLAEVDHGDGRYSFEFAAPAQPTQITFEATVNGFSIGDLPSVDAGGAADGAQTEYRFEQGHPPQAASPDQVRILVRPRDANGLRLGPNADIELRLASAGDSGALPAPSTTSGGSTTSVSGSAAIAPWSEHEPKVWVDPTFGQEGQNDGDFLFVLRKTPGYPDYLPAGSVEILCDGQSVAFQPYTYFPQQF